MKHNLPIPLFDTLAHLAKQSAPEQLSLEQKYEFALIQAFLKQYDGSNDTFTVYRREMERLAQWSWMIRDKSLLTLGRDDIEAFIAFCQSPPTTWIGTKTVSRFKNSGGYRVANDDWRMFVVKQKKSQHKQAHDLDASQYQLSQKALQSLFAAISSFYNHLIREGEAEINPITLIRQKSKYLRKQQAKRQIRRLTSVQWQYVIDTTEALAECDPLHERSLFIVSALYLMYLRISELVTTQRWQPEMGDFYQDANGYWWFKTVGKGNKERDISVSDAMLKSLKRYRHALALAPTLPAPGEATPLIIKTKGLGGITSTRAIRGIVQQCFDAAIDRLHRDGLDDDAIALEEATVHWLRHTGISDDLNKNLRPIAHVREDAGHSSSATTDLYNDAELQARHQSAKHKAIIPKEK